MYSLSIIFLYTSSVRGIYVLLTGSMKYRGSTMCLMSNPSSLSFLLMIFSVAVYSNFSTTRTNKETVYVGNQLEPKQRNPTAPSLPVVFSRAAFLWKRFLIKFFPNTSPQSISMVTLTLCCVFTS